MRIVLEIDGEISFKGQNVLSELEKWMAKYQVSKLHTKFDSIVRKSKIYIECNLTKVSSMIDDFTECLRKQMWFEKPQVIDIQFSKSEVKKLRDILVLGEV